VTKTKRVRNPFIDDEASVGEEDEDEEEDVEEDEDEDGTNISQGTSTLYSC
jgi:hypothetical protein